MQINNKLSFIYCNDKSLWLFYFAAALAVALMVQLVLLPYVFSEWHHGDGLLVGGDWIGFHRTAIEMAEKIEIEGWSVWELRPRGWMPAGVASALYALILPKPWVLAPLNAAVHATTVLFVFKLVLFFFNNRGAAFFAVMPFAFFPSAMLWYTQVHRDGYNILGMILFFYGFLLIMRINPSKNQLIDLNREGLGFLLSIIGLIIIWMVRPHALVIYIFMTGLLFVFCFFWLLILIYRRKVALANGLSKLFLLIIVMLVIYPLTLSEGAAKYVAGSDGKVAQHLVVIDDADHLSDGPKDDSEVSGIVESNLTKNGFQWERSLFVPKVIDNQLYSIAVLRSVTFPEKYGETASGIDLDVEFNGAVDFILYLPRALQIAFLAPFPVDWFKEGSFATTTFFRRVSAFEMIFIYIIYLPLIYGVWIWRKKLELYLTMLFSSLMMLPIVYSTPNLGTVYRYRYGFLMLIVSLGVSAFFNYLQDKPSGEGIDS